MKRNLSLPRRLALRSLALLTLLIPFCILFACMLASDGNALKVDAYPNLFKLLHQNNPQAMAKFFDGEMKIAQAWQVLLAVTGATIVVSPISAWLIWCNASAHHEEA